MAVVGPKGTPDFGSSSVTRRDVGSVRVYLPGLPLMEMKERLAQTTVVPDSS